MSDQYMEMLTRWASEIRDRESMIRFVGPWNEMATYGTEVLEILREGQEMSVEDTNSLAFQLWMAHNDSTRRCKRFHPPIEAISERPDLSHLHPYDCRAYPPRRGIPRSEKMEARAYIGQLVDISAELSRGLNRQEGPVQAQQQAVRPEGSMLDVPNAGP